MPAAKYEWYAGTVMGPADVLASNLNALEEQGYEIFSVGAMLFPNQHGWVVVGRKENPKAEQKEQTPPAASPNINVESTQEERFGSRPVPKPLEHKPPHRGRPKK